MYMCLANFEKCFKVLVKFNKYKILNKIFYTIFYTINFTFLYDIITDKNQNNYLFCIYKTVFSIASCSTHLKHVP